MIGIEKRTQNQHLFYTKHLHHSHHQGHALDSSKEFERGCYRTLLANFIQISQATRILSGCHLLFEYIQNHIKKSVTNVQKPLEVGLLLTIKLRHLATGETHTYLHHHWLVSLTIICKFGPVVCEANLAELQVE